MSDVLNSRIQTLINRTLQAAHRHLIQPDDPDFIEMVTERLALSHGEVSSATDIPDSTITRATKYVFSILLYRAYSHDGSPEQERAFRSAQAYLYSLLLYRLDGDKDLADDLTQQTLMQVWQAIRRQPLREPGAFLSFILKTGLHLVYRQYRRDKPVSINDNDESTDTLAEETHRFSEASALVREVELDVENDLRDNRLREILSQCLEGKDLRIIVEHFIKGHSFKELALAWQQKAAQLSLDKFRALKRLRRNCPELKELIGE